MLWSTAHLVKKERKGEKRKKKNSTVLLTVFLIQHMKNNARNKAKVNEVAFWIFKKNTQLGKENDNQQPVTECWHMNWHSQSLNITTILNVLTHCLELGILASTDNYKLSNVLTHMAWKVGRSFSLHTCTSFLYPILFQYKFYLLQVRSEN